jgi:hypothetical protein
MDIFRYSRTVYGQQTLEGISYELLWVFAGVAAVIIICHLGYCLLRKPIKMAAD